MERSCNECKHYVESEVFSQNDKFRTRGCELWDCEFEPKDSQTMPKPLENIINETFEEVKVAMCEDYCRYPREWNEEEEGAELIDSEICRTCPLNRL